MSNPTGVNGPTAYDAGAQTVPYGDKKQQGALAKTAPSAGGKQTALVLGTPRRAVEAALAKRKPRREDGPRVPPITSPTPPPSGVVGPMPPELEGQVAPLWPTIYPPGTIQNYQSLWDQLAATPGASPLVLAYAARARQA